ncbi:metal-dependent hydrolase [Pseudomonas salomonii]|uniref:Metal-dependent hydrolase n=2 Tax=Pseudomonas salomonii TaxID=191391 RepID=A0ABS9GLV1_9PSED|nr:metal-dependent hydrolase [Pseudomonas salomonii]
MLPRTESYARRPFARRPLATRVDSHVHFYTAHDLQHVAGLLPYGLPEPHPIKVYLDKLIDAGITPSIINNVHLSILPDSQNVFASFDHLQTLQVANPQRYGGIQLAGTIHAQPSYATQARLGHPQVIGARIVLHDARPETVAESSFCDEQWQAFYARLLPHQHLHIYAKEAQTNLRVLRQIPYRVPVLIDHLGSCHYERGATEPAYSALLAEAARRGNVGFKGPGYRTSVNPEQTARFVTRIIRAVGAGNLLLEASDAPHVGVGSNRVAYAEQFDVPRTFAFVEAVARHVSKATAIPASQLLRGACGQWLR